MRTLALIAAAVGSGAQDGSLLPAPLESRAVVAFELEGEPGLRHEYFELAQDGEYVGRAASTVGVRGGSLRAELLIHLEPIATRVHHVERNGPRGPRLVWREVRERSGRTVLAEWSEDGERLVDIDWCGGDAVRHETTPEGGALLPLFLVDSVRSGEFPSGTFDVFLPASSSVEELSVTVERAPFGSWESRLALRRLVLRRVDGTLAGEYVFAANELVCFRLQEGGPVARRTSLGAYRERAREDERRKEEARAEDAD